MKKLLRVNLDDEDLVNGPDYKQTGTITLYKGKPFTGICYSNDEDLPHILENETEFVNGLRHGKSIDYDVLYALNHKKKRKIKYIEEYRNDELTNNCTWYHEKSQNIKEEDLDICDNSFLRKSYYQNGQLEMVSYYENGYLHGPRKFYYQNGQIKSEVIMKNDDDTHGSGGFMHGWSKDYYENGQVRCEGLYQYGIKEGVWKYYYESGQLKMTESYKKVLKKIHNTRIGGPIKRKCWDENGQEIDCDKIWRST
tara:strand:+ start:4031 stop:4789 length:759 start_codon:yes stop_codon:yes gene_type:complete